MSYKYFLLLIVFCIPLVSAVPVDQGVYFNCSSVNIIYNVTENLTVSDFNVTNHNVTFDGILHTATAVSETYLDFYRLRLNYQDTDDGTPLNAVTIIFTDPEGIVRTNTTDQYINYFVHEGSYILNVSKTGYNDYDLTTTFNDSVQIFNVNMTNTPAGASPGTSSGGGTTETEDEEEIEIIDDSRLVGRKSISVPKTTIDISDNIWLLIVGVIIVLLLIFIVAFFKAIINFSKKYFKWILIVGVFIVMGVITYYLITG